MDSLEGALGKIHQIDERMWTKKTQDHRGAPLGIEYVCCIGYRRTTEKEAIDKETSY